MRTRSGVAPAFLICFAFSVATAAGAPQASKFPWSPDSRCKLNPANPRGLHPGAYAALQKLSLAHRITQGMNSSSEPRNVHQQDTVVDGKPYTGAADISVRCLTETQIKALLGKLAVAGFAAWYRKGGQDGWTGPTHIHAVWAGCPLKSFLRWQVESWLGGGNGLGSNPPYRFWQPTPDMKETVQKLYRSRN